MWGVLRRVALSLLLLAVISASGAYLWLRASLPITEGTLALPGLGGAVTITRDGHGIPTIVAQNDRDAAFALGFVHAQDRLFQMDLMRRYGSGRLAEWFGPRALASDRAIRTLGLYRAAAEQYPLLSPALRSVYDGYAAGVNAFLATRRALPPEYAVLGVEPEAWTPIDSLVWGKIMDLRLTTNYRLEMLRQLLAQRLGPADLDVLFPDYPSDAPIVLGAIGRVLDGLPPQAPASNEWVVDGRHSASGKPILANDTHLDFSAPSVWYLARIETPDDTISGVTSAGWPMVVIGHNRRVAWGFSTTGGDVEDVFVEKVDPIDPSRYLTEAGPVPFLTRQEKILVRGAEPVTVTVRATQHGPVVSDPGTSDPVLALSATWLHGEDRTPQALWDMTHARDWDSFREALRPAVAPEQDIVYADIAGNIGFLAPARIPIRSKGDGAMPVPGWTGEYEWTGFVPFEALPLSYNPPSGRFYAANNKIVPDSYPYLITRDWELPDRAERIGELLNAVPLQSPDASAAIQGDTVSVAARRLLPLMLGATPSSRAGVEAIGLLAKWNGRMSRDRVEPLLFIAWLSELNRQILGQKLGPGFSDYWLLHPDVIENILRNHAEWCNSGDPPSAKTCPQRLGAALDRALANLAQRYGADMKGWRWGIAHPASFPHPIWSQLPLLGAWFGLEIPDDGSFDTIDNATMADGNEAEPLAAIHGPTMRMIVDMASPEGARFMLAPGQSGNPLSPHYRDLMVPWRDVSYLSFSSDASGGVLVLIPR